MSATLPDLIESDSESAKEEQKKPESKPLISLADLLAGDPDFDKFLPPEEAKSQNKPPEEEPDLDKD